MCEGSVESICLTLFLVYTSLERPVKRKTGDLFLELFLHFYCLLMREIFGVFEEEMMDSRECEV